MIGERLAEVRKDHRDTQADLAERLGVSLPAVRAWEQGKSSPSHEMLVEICRLYGISADFPICCGGESIYQKSQRHR